MTAPSPNTHRAVLEYAVPPRIEKIAAGPREFCAEALTRYLSNRPNAVRPYADEDLDSGAQPLLLAVDGSQYPSSFEAISHAYDNDPVYHAHVRLLIEWFRGNGYSLTNPDGHTL